MNDDFRVHLARYDRQRIQVVAEFAYYGALNRDARQHGQTMFLLNVTMVDRDKLTVVADHIWVRCGEYTDLEYGDIIEFTAEVYGYFAGCNYRGVRKRLRSGRINYGLQNVRDLRVFHAL